MLKRMTSTTYEKQFGKAGFSHNRLPKELVTSFRSPYKGLIVQELDKFDLARKHFYTKDDVCRAVLIGVPNAFTEHVGPEEANDPILMVLFRKDHQIDLHSEIRTDEGKARVKEIFRALLESICTDMTPAPARGEKKFLSLEPA